MRAAARDHVTDWRLKVAAYSYGRGDGDPFPGASFGAAPGFAGLMPEDAMVKDMVSYKPRHVANDEGFCYLHGVREDNWPIATAALGYNPWQLRVFCWLQANPGAWSGKTLRYSVGGDPLSDGKGYAQAHWEPHPHGEPLQVLLNMPAYLVRLGAVGDVRVPTSEEEGPDRPAQRMLNAPAPSPVVRVPFHVALRSGANGKTRCSFSPRANSAVTNVTKFFESAELTEFEVSVVITGGTGVAVFVGFSTGGTAPTNQEGFMCLPSCSILAGQDIGSTVSSLSVPAGFGREVKAVSVGNPDPVLHVLVDSTDPYNVAVRGHISLILRGSGVPASILIAST